MADRKFYLICDDDCRVEGMSKEQIFAVIEQAAKNGLVFDTEAAFITKVKEGNKGSFLKFWLGTQAEYNALIARGEKDPQCFYIFTDCDSTAELTDKIKYLQNELSTLTADEIGAAPAGYGYGGIPDCYITTDDTDGTLFEAEMDNLLSSMANGETRQIRFCCYPHLDGNNYVGTIYKDSPTYAVLTGSSYNGHYAIKVKNEGIWSKFNRWNTASFAPAGYGYGDMPTSCGPADDDSTFPEILSYQFSLIPNKTKQIKFTKGGVTYLGTLWNAGNNYGTLVAHSYIESQIKHHFHQLVRICTDGVWGEWVNFSPSAFVPTGYGLGEVTSKKVSSADDALATGWYQLPATSTVNWLYCASYSKTYKRQEQYGANNHQIRYMRNGVWEPWEWIDPPMISAKEYRTTERRNGEPVYTVAACNVPLTNSTNQHVENLIASDAKDIHIEGFANNTKSGISYPLYRLNLSVVACDNGTNKGYLSVAAHENLSDWKATFILKYVK